MSERLALISDIHGNAVALEAVLAELDERGVDRIVCLGDIAAGGPQPREAIDLLRRLECPAVRGNADGWLLEGFPAGRSDATRRLGAVVAWAGELLAPDERDYLAALPSTLELVLGDWTLLCCHASPRSDVEPMLAETPPDRVDAVLPAPPPDVLACGHTHLQLLRVHRRSLLVNPGSVGLPLGSLGAADEGPPLPAWAEYAIVEVGAAAGISFCRVAVDVDALAGATVSMPQITWASDLERRIVRWNARTL